MLLLLCGTLVAMAASSEYLRAASTATMTVSATVTSATSLAIDPVGAAPNGCQTSTPNVTSFGAVMPGVSATTTADCNVKFGSSNNTSMLRLYQADSFGDAMQRTVDAGWSTQNSTIGTTIRDLDAVNELVAWGVGESGAIVKTVDGGATWGAQASGVSVTIRGIEAIDVNTAWAVGDVSGGVGVVLRTLNGGTTWSPVAAGVGANNCYGVAAVGTSLIWVSCDGGVVRHSANGGTSWTSQNTNTAQSLLRIRAVDANVVWAVGQNGTVTHTTDGGATWTAQAAAGGSTNFVRDIAAFDGNTAWAVAEGGRLLRTTNGGSSWNLTTSGTTSYFGIAATNMSNATIVGAGGTVKVTTDGGATWTSDTSGTANELRAIVLTPAGVRWAAGASGTVIRTTLVSIPGYDDDNVGSDSTWTEGSNMFGACLRAVGGANAAATWAINPGNTCPATNGAYWNAVPTTSGSAGSKIAGATAPSTDNTAAIRFGLRTSSSQPPGQYEARVVFEVVAPNS